MKISQVDLISDKRDITIDQADKKAYSLTDDKLPHSDGTAASIGRIIDYLKVKTSARYKRTATQTFCNIYAHDFARLMRAYVPRVWWTEQAIQRHDFERVVYGKNVVEMSANLLYAWFPKYGSLFGWIEVNKTQAQAAANAGRCVIMVAANKSAKKSGHICAIVAETPEQKAVGSRGVIVYPLMSQAGAINKPYFSEDWWSSGHQPFKIYVYGS